MEAAAGLLLMFITVSGVEFFCDGRQDEAQCLGALGGTVNIQLMDNVSENPRFRLTKDKSLILMWKNNTIVFNSIEHRSSFSSSNGTFKISNLNKTDSGRYELETFDSNGKQTGSRTLQFTVQAGVSSVQLLSECLSQGQMNVSCSSEGGDSPQYSWTLDGHTLTDSELLSGNNETNIIVLRGNISGRLICSVRNQVRESFNEEIISSCVFIICTSNGTHKPDWVFEDNNSLCDEPTRVSTTENPVGKNTESNNTELNLWPVLVGVLLSGLIVSVVGTALICALRKKTNTEAEEDVEEPTYSNVTIVQQERTERGQSVEIEYTQVKFSKKPHPTGPAVSECVYSEVRKREVV